MNYDELNGDAILFDAEDSFFDPEDYESYTEEEEDYSTQDEDYAEWRNRRGRRTRNARGAHGSRMSRTDAGRYQGRGTIDTPAGKAQVTLPPDLVSKREFKALEAKVLANNRAILKNGKAIDVLNSNGKRLDDGLLGQRKSIDGFRRRLQGLQNSQLFSVLLPPKLEKITVTSAVPTDTTEERPAEVAVKNANFDTMSALLPLMLSGSLGGNNSGASDGQNMMLPLLLILNDRDKDRKDKQDNTLLLLAMMMMNK